MIKVIYDKKKIEISGHANSNKKGKDLICAAISSIVIGSINALTGFEKQEININDGKIIIYFNHNLSYDDKIRIEMLMIEIETVANKYPKNVKIIKDV